VEAERSVVAPQAGGQCIVHVLALSISDIGVVDWSSMVGVCWRARAEESRGTSVGAHVRCPVAGVG
jgi:hypothetical protein